jgi:uncharacterized protein Yka (UPF0111/DUF47 family)
VAEYIGSHPFEELIHLLHMLDDLVVVLHKSSHNLVVTDTRITTEIREVILNLEMGRNFGR